MVKNYLLYIITVLIWSSTWFAIKLQVIHASPEVSIAYRLLVVSVSLYGWCRLKGYSLTFSLKDHFYLFLMGISMFSVHLLFLYEASEHLISGLVSVVFSGVSFFSIVYNYMFFKTKPSLNMLLGVVVGMGGLIIFFWEDISCVSFESKTVLGLELAVVGTMIFAMGGSVTRRNHRRGLDLIPTMTMASIYGTAIIFLYSWIQGVKFELPQSYEYWAALFYLAVPNAMVAFICYLTLVKRAGPVFAGYTSVLLPVLAIMVSVIMEGYQPTKFDFIGGIFVVMGNILVMWDKPIEIKKLVPNWLQIKSMVH